MEQKIAARGARAAVVCIITVMCAGAGDEPSTKDDPKKDDKPAAVRIEESANGRAVEVLVGREIEVSLVGDKRMTGWCAPDPWPTPPARKDDKRAPQSKALEYLGPGFVAAADAKDSAIGAYLFRYKAVATGERALTFNYIYPDGHGYENMPRLATQLVRQFIVTVRVTEGK